MDIGPATVRCGTSVGTYVLNHQPPELGCLKDFLKRVRTSTVTVDAFPLGGQWLVTACAHVLQIDIQPGTVTVTDIFRGVLSP
jgi:hypothetical protein